MRNYLEYHKTDLFLMVLLALAVGMGADLLKDFFAAFPEKLRESFAQHRLANSYGLDLRPLSVPQPVDSVVIFQKIYVGAILGLTLYHLWFGRWTTAGHAIGYGLMILIMIISSRQDREVVHVHVREEVDWMPIIIFLALACGCGAA